MSKLRFVFEKTGRARYISHLDLMRTFQRAFNRAGLELKHSEGFNPHPQISVLLPLQLGCESVCERLDADVLSPREGMTDELNRVLPEGVRMISVGEPVMKPGAIKYTRCELRLFYGDGADHAAEAAKTLGSGKVEIMKKTKRGEGLLDIAPHIRLLDARDGRIELILSAFEPTVNPADVASALRPEYFLARRLEIYAENMEKFI